MKKSDSKFATFIDGKWIPLDKKFKIGITVAVVLVPALAFYFAYFKPKSEQVARLETKRATLVKDIQNLRQKERNKPALLAQVKEVEAEFETAAQMLPRESEIPQLLKDISALGRSAGLDFLTFIPRPEKERDFFNEIPVDINIRGPYHSVGYFFDQVSKLDRIVSVSNVTMGSPQTAQGEMLLNSNCQLVTYRFTNIKVSDEQKKK